jgi:isoquinoline 1-oxidoreductase beta subunit
LPTTNRGLVVIGVVPSLIALDGIYALLVAGQVQPTEAVGLDARTRGDDPTPRGLPVMLRFADFGGKGRAMSESGIPRRRFLGYVLAAPTLTVAAQLGLDALAPSAAALIPSPPEPADLYDLTDLLTDAAAPTSNLITVVLNGDGIASFALPRAEVGQGITTAVAMTIADELDLPLDRIEVTLADARPELIWNQITGTSNTMHAMFTPVRVAAAIARGRLLEAAAVELGAVVSRLTTHQGVISAPDGSTVTYGQVARAAAAATTTPMSVVLKDEASFHLIGTPQGRVDALDIVTGRKQFALDLEVPNALPTMVCRPPTINGAVLAVHNADAVKAMAGVTDVIIVPTGVAVRATTFGQCIDAVDALDVAWGAGTEDGKSDGDVLAELVGAELPFAIPQSPLVKMVDHRFTFAFATTSPLETNCAIADVTPDRAEIWSSLKTPIIALQRIAQTLGLPQDKVTCHVVQGGGSFGRHQFFDGALEAAQISQRMGKPVKLMWHRTDDFRQGRMHPMCTSRVRAGYLGTNVLSYEQRHTSVSTDYRHGIGEVVSATPPQLPYGDLSYAQTVFALTQNMPYNFGVTDQSINEVDLGFNTGTMRNVYSPNVTTARELIVDELAKAMRKDAYQFRREFLKEDRTRAVLDKVTQVGQWGRAVARGTAQGLGVHSEYKSRAAALVEIDCRPATVGRTVRDAYTGPRVTKVVFAIDVGLPVNPTGIEAQMMGGIMDAIGLALTFSLHLRNGVILEGSWDHTFYTRQWNVPLELEIIVMPPTSDVPGGAGEMGVAATFAAVACAYARATGTVPTSFPINHNRAALGFDPLPTVPPLPEEPVDGLSHLM